MRNALTALLGMAVMVVVTARAEETKDKKDVTLKGTIVCTKCELKETPACGQAIKTKIADKDVIVYFMDGGVKESYHKKICGGPAMGSVTGVMVEKDKKWWITPSKDGVKYE